MFQIKESKKSAAEDEKFWRWVMGISGALIVVAVVAVAFVGGTGSKVLSSVGVISPSGSPTPTISNETLPGSPPTTQRWST